MEIGRILKPQGIRGEVKVEPLTDDSSRFCVLKSVSVGGVPKRIQSVRISGGFVFIKFAGVDDRNAAELLRDKFISIDRASAAPLASGEFYQSDLMGAALCVSYDAGAQTRKLGTITAVQSFGAADVISVACDDGREMSFPFVKALDPSFDEAEKSFTVNGDRLNEVAVYED